MDWQEKAGASHLAGRPGIQRWRLWLRWALMAVIGIVALELVVVVAYRFIAPPVSSLMLMRAMGGAETDYRWVDLDHISPHLVRSVITSEDARFCLNNGVDWDVLAGLAGDAIDGDDGPSRGGSTITMQTAKNLFLWPQRSYLRKALEIPLATWINLVWPKRRVVEVYLNVAEWGPGIYGAEAAARYHFGKPAADLTRREAALLAASLPSPMERAAGEPNRQVKRLARRIERRIAGTVPYLDCLPGLQ